MFRIIIVLPALYNYEAWPLPLGGVFENRMLRRIFRPEGAELTGGFRKLYNKCFAMCTVHRIYYNDQIEEVEVGEACSTFVIHEDEYRVLVGKPEVRSLGYPRPIWNSNV
jgi:hypothetical protein